MKKPTNFRVYLIGIFIFVLFLISIFLAYRAGINSIEKENIIIPKAMTGLIYELNGNNVILKLDKSNIKQRDLLMRIVTFCENVGIKECSLPDFFE